MLNELDWEYQFCTSPMIGRASDKITGAQRIQWATMKLCKYTGASYPLDMREFMGLMDFSWLTS